MTPAMLYHRANQASADAIRWRRQGCPQAAQMCRDEAAMYRSLAKAALRA